MSVAGTAENRAHYARTLAPTYTLIATTDGRCAFPDGEWAALSLLSRYELWGTWFSRN